MMCWYNKHHVQGRVPHVRTMFAACQSHYNVEPVALSMLYNLRMKGRKVSVLMTVFFDAVKLEEEDCGKRRIIGWFQDEVSAIGAAAERAIMESALLSSRRKMPELAICSEYREEFAHRPIVIFRRATRVKWGPMGRKVVRVPGTFGKVWMSPVAS